MKKRRIYYSFHDIPGVNQPGFDHQYAYSYGEPHGLHFSETEIRHILLAMLTLAFAFSAIFISQGLNIVSAIAVGFLGIVSSFLLHELAHKFTAQKFGMWAEFRAYPMGLLTVIIFMLISISTGFPIIFAAPGAVYIMGSAGRKEIGVVSIAGPLVNFIIALILLPLVFIFYESSVGSLFGLICFINSLLAVFNMIPFGPLDGRKVIEWNALIWAALMISSLLLLVAIENMVYLI